MHLSHFVSALRGGRVCLQPEPEAVRPDLQRPVGAEIGVLAELLRRHHCGHVPASLGLQALRRGVVFHCLRERVEALEHVVLHGTVTARSRGVRCAAGYDQGAHCHGYARYPAPHGAHGRHGLYPAPGVVAKAQRHCQRRVPLCGHVQQGLGVVRPCAVSQAAERRLVAARLHVAHRQDPGQPHQGIEPVQAQRHIRQGLHQVVAAPYVTSLVRQHALALALAQPFGQVDPRPEHPGHERRVYPPRDAHAPLQRGGVPQPDAQAQVRHQRPEQHRRRDDDPKPGQHANPVHACAHVLRRQAAGGRSHRRSERRRRRHVSRREAGDGLHIVHRRYAPRSAHHRRAAQVQHRERRAYGHRAEQPEQHHAPQRIGAPARRAFERQPGQHHHQYDRARRQAHVHRNQEGIRHIAHPLILSIRSCSSSISFFESFLREVKAARKAGSEPSKVSSTKCSLRAE